MSSRTCSLYSRFPPAAAQCALETVAVLVIGTHRNFAVKPAHGVVVGLIGVGPPLPRISHWRLRALPPLRCTPQYPLWNCRNRSYSVWSGGRRFSLPAPGPEPGRRGIGRADLLRRGCCAVSGSRNGIQIQLFRRIRRRVVQVAPPPLHQQDSRYSGELKRGMVAGGLHSALQPRILFSEAGR